MTATSKAMGMGPSQRRRAKVWGAAVLILLLAAGGWFLTHRGGVHYITATPTMSTVQETVSLSGTVAPQQEDDLNFGASGTVESVAVSAGQTVKAGQTLATLQPASLQASLAEAEAQLAEAKATLATDQAGGNNTTATTVANDKAQLSSAEASVTADQTIDNVKLAQAEAAVTAAENQLASDRSQGASAAVIAKDQAAVVSAQQNETLTKAQDQQSLSQAEAQVTAAQNQLATAEQQASAEAPVAAAQLQAASATVAADEQTVADDQAALADATLKAPYAGTVAAVNITAGQTVGGGGALAADPVSGTAGSSSGSSSSTSADIVLVGNGNYAIDCDASETEVPQLQVGEQATITLTSATAPVYGTVAQVASQAVDSSGVSEFPIVIDVTGHPTGLLDGDTVDVSVLVKEAADVLTVPTSAVHTLGSRSYVTVINPSGGTKLAPVTVGLEGTTLTQIKSGLTTHDEVVLATTNAVVPGITGTTGRFGGGGFGAGGFGGGFGGGGFGGGGFGGGGFGGGGFGGGGS